MKVLTRYKTTMLEITTDFYAKNRRELIDTANEEHALPNLTRAHVAYADVYVKVGVLIRDKDNPTSLFFDMEESEDSFMERLRKLFYY